MALRRIGIYGGTFDPVHNGHLEVARRVLQLFDLDEIIFVPACVPPHKRNANITSAFHRFAMVALATEAEQRLLISTVELEAPDRPYAVDTVERMRTMLGETTELFILLGADSWLEIKSWHEWERLLTLANFIVMTRPGYELDPMTLDMPIPIVNVFGVERRPPDTMTMHDRAPRAFLTDAVQSDVSAVRIRAAVKANNFESVKQMLPSSVAAYIEKYRLYRD
jgi:nicotinate-nucleotide adenylyltransferase